MADKKLGSVIVEARQLTDNGRTKFQARVGVNGEPVFDAAQVSERVARTQIDVVEREDTGPLLGEADVRIADKEISYVYGGAKDVTAASMPSEAAKAVPNTYIFPLKFLSFRQSLAITAGFFGALGFILGAIIF